LQQLKPDSHFTGVWGVVQPQQTLTTALRLQPNTKHVVVVGGVGAYDRYVEAIVRKIGHWGLSKSNLSQGSIALRATSGALVPPGFELMRKLSLGVPLKVFPAPRGG
jgi:hypothetical protein